MVFSPPRVSGALTPQVVAFPKDPILPKEALDEFKDVLNEAFLICQAMSPELVGRAIVDYVLRMSETDRFYSLFTGEPKVTAHLNDTLFDESHGANDAKLDWLFRLSSRVWANWSGTDQFYTALVARLAVALSSEVTLANKRQYDDSMLTDAYLERLETKERVYSILYQNRILVVLACLILYADVVKVLNLFQPEKEKKDAK